MVSLIEDVTGALDHAAGSTDEAFGRQWDDEPGGGWADTRWNPVRVADPNKEFGVDLFGDADDADAQVKAPWDGPDSPADSPGAGLNDDESGNETPDPPDFTPKWVQWMMDHQEEVAVLLVVMAVAYVAGPFAEVAANVTEGS